MKKNDALRTILFLSYYFATDQSETKSSLREINAHVRSIHRHTRIASFVFLNKSNECFHFSTKLRQKNRNRLKCDKS